MVKYGTYSGTLTLNQNESQRSSEKNNNDNIPQHPDELNQEEATNLIPDKYISQLQPHTILLKDGETVATMYPIPAYSECLPYELLTFLLDEFNMEIEKGDSFPYYETLTLEEFKEVWFHKGAYICVMVLGEIPELDYGIENDLSVLENNYGTDIDTMRQTSQYKVRKQTRNLNLNIQWEKQCLGIFALQPAYPGRSSHVVTGTFLVNAGIRGKGIGKTLVETFVEWAQRLGYTSSCFPLIYGTNVGIRRILEGLNFKRIGKLPESAILKGFDVPVDSFIYGKEFAHISKSIDLLRDPQRSIELAKYERLIYYLDTGKYPAHCDRNEKARLRVTGKSYSLINGKLMTRGREVVYDLDKQRQVALDFHNVDHQGINKVTTKIAEQYHWKGIKNTVSEVIQECAKCKLRYQDGTGVIVTQSEHVPQARMLPNNHIPIDPSLSMTGEPNVQYRHNNDDDNNHNNQLSQMAAAVVGSLTSAQEDEPTPPDPEELQVRKSSNNINNTSLLQRLRFDDNNKTYHSVKQTVNSNTNSLNSFNHFVTEDQDRRKRRYTNGAPDSLLTDANNMGITNSEGTRDIFQESSKGTFRTKKSRKNTENNTNNRLHAPTNSINNNNNNNNNNETLAELLNPSNNNVMNQAMLHFEDNVMAAIEMVQNEQTSNANNDKKKDGGATHQSLHDSINNMAANSSKPSQGGELPTPFYDMFHFDEYNEDEDEDYNEDVDNQIGEVEEEAEDDDDEEEIEETDVIEDVDLLKELANDAELSELVNQVGLNNKAK
ncbi:Spt10p NDAI_0G06130 [Naumovozyma dairenensis CBS 421]|uniref:N-acetyltransferase domain-containing protein n=1 Tax=Naumovozyma dairenensis (strain ATCC 10597 / BCRC 20456 / CBS 421 / NBRC 0211 / NRRL Y-12639) TaxID=1071378 RepID=J7S4R3_NAUDC|nr:hypothetical protein NDAI_0G06130 [Naumovozyma dairenensis CBS 421]CCK73596.1 hypothetical protein NDAI_0G06130 [Naumovozyma dairenensis CBS 421]